MNHLLFIPHQSLLAKYLRQGNRLVDVVSEPSTVHVSAKVEAGEHLLHLLVLRALDPHAVHVRLHLGKVTLGQGLGGQVPKLRQTRRHFDTCNKMQRPSTNHHL